MTVVHFLYFMLSGSRHGSLPPDIPPGDADCGVQARWPWRRCTIEAGWAEGTVPAVHVELALGSNGSTWGDFVGPQFPCPSYDADRAKMRFDLSNVKTLRVRV